MYNSQQNVYGMGATQIVVGISTLVRIIPPPNQIATTIKIASGSGTLWITPAPGIGAGLTSASSASCITGGYFLGASEVFNIGGPAIFYLSASAATMTAAVVFGYTSGSSYV